MGIFGAALRGFGKALGKSKKKGINPKKRLETFKKASQKADVDQTKKKIKRTVKDFKAASERAEKFSRTLMKQDYSKSAVNKYLTKEYKKQQRKP